jgi:hypothetical protein
VVAKADGAAAVETALEWARAIYNAGTPA